ncbi:MAG: hypothetical protein K8F25_13735 [Fimbriimonadaceae bacterium]|nr:hypothetical protein [Alphaproteobacteria bacterium]
MKVLEPININGMKVPNRIMVPAMVTRLSGSDGFVNQEITDRYVRYAEGEVGLIVVEAMAIHHSKSGPLLRISEDKFIPGLRDLVKKVHDTSESKIVPQIIHFLKVARSGWRQTVDMLSQAEIDQIIEEFGDAVARAREAGFDGAEIHSAHAYTLSSFLSRTNSRKDEFTGKTLEGRLQLIGRVMDNIRRKAGKDFPVGVRFLAEEFIKGGNTIEDAKLNGLRMAQLGFDYLSLSVGGKFEYAVHIEGEVLYPYTGYSGERCMPDAHYPNMVHAHLGGAIKSFINASGYDVPVIVAGKISKPEHAEKLISEGVVDMVAIARGLLADPDMPKKIRLGLEDQIVKCDYCNVCKSQDGAHQPVKCFLWPREVDHAPQFDPARNTPQWQNSDEVLSATEKTGLVKLRWAKAEGNPVYYDVYRADDQGEVRIIDAVKVRQWADNDVLAGREYRYYVRACGATGLASAPSNSITIKQKIPDQIHAAS